MEQHNNAEGSTDLVNDAIAEGGAYEVIRKRLESQGERLSQEVSKLNSDRLNEFGSAEMSVLARVRVRTENNCIARDIVQVGSMLLFGYNVFIGLKKETRVEDVFALYQLADNDGNYEINPVPLDGTFLSQASFVNDFDELYRYYKSTRLTQLTVKDGKLLAAFQIGERLDDIRVFRWSISADGQSVSYIDNRGERDIQLPDRYDFAWITTTREDIVHGRHSHVNILDTLFVDTLNGKLTIKVENNTEHGLGIHSEAVEDSTQSLDDAHIAYAEVGDLILLQIRPYREQTSRYFIFNTLTQGVLRVDAIGQSCVQLPEDHGLIFPGGYYLQNGEYKAFDEETSGLTFKRAIRSPNGEDVLYLFYEPEAGIVGLFAYNLINKKLSNPIYGHGYALAENGQLVIFHAEDEPTRVHPMQVWQTPYQSAEFASTQPVNQSFYGKVGNAELVRGISDLYSVCRIIDSQSVSLRLYEELSALSQRIFDDHYWLGEAETQNIAATLKEIAKTSELVIDEFEKVESIRQQSAQAMMQAEHKQQSLLQSIRPDDWRAAEQYADALSQLRQQRGHLTTLRDYRYIDSGRIDVLDQQLQEADESLARSTVDFLSSEAALEPYLGKIAAIDQEMEKASTNANLKPLIESIEHTAAGLDILSELMGTLHIEDATVRTKIVDALSVIYAKLNQSKASARNKQNSLGSEEAKAQFSAQFKLFSQSIVNGLSVATTPEKCDEQLARLLVQLEELESQFSHFSEFLPDIIEKRDELYESFEGHKQRLLDERQRQAQSVSDAATRILSSIEKRSRGFNSADELNTYFASDALPIKIGELIETLKQLDASVKADEAGSRLKSIKEQALRSLRDKIDIFESGGNVIRLGPRHRFSVNTQELDITILPREDELYIHLTGTNFYQAITDQALYELRDFWGQSLESETSQVYRSEYLAAQILHAANERQNGVNPELLQQGLLDDKLLADTVRDFTSPRYKEGYQRGIHDHDAVAILKSILPALEQADLLRYDPLSRGLAQIFWTNVQGNNAQKNKVQSKTNHNVSSPSLTSWPERAQSAAQMHEVFASSDAVALLTEEVSHSMTQFFNQHALSVTDATIHRSASYLVAELGRERVEFIGSKYASQLVEEFRRSLDDSTWRRYQSALDKMAGWPGERWQLSTAWLQALVKEKNLNELTRYIPEAVAMINAEERLARRPTQADTQLVVQGLLGEHPLIQKQQLSFSLDDFLQRMEVHRLEVLPAYRRYQQLRHDTITSYRKSLRLNEFKPRPLSSFVRNRLINESYLPLIGDNLAKQMGTVGEDKRTDLMGLLMMISPPGYGKTTLMEYVASRLGLIFMKINCPSLGHNVLSLDPAQAPNATARQELIKLNLGLEMGNNVMLYLDDIQHTHPEFLQKFISLCDGTRRIDGVWEGETKTYDMRGRKFCVVMAGNPYTESGEVFKIPDMLANRADIYNLGDILGGMEEQFALSYIENALTSNSVLAPLATREMADVYKLVDMARGKGGASTDLSHTYSAAELNEITEILKKLFVIQEVILKINQQYIASAAQNDKYRTEPAFKLQGSYRNMNKMTEKVSAVMNTGELMQMISDHYLGEAQLLTTGTEDNLLKLAELRGDMSDEQEARWQQIKADFLRNKAMGGDGADTGAKVVAQLTDLVGAVQTLSVAATRDTAPTADQDGSLLQDALAQLSDAVAKSRPAVTVINEPVPGVDKLLSVLAGTIEHSILPLVHSMEKKLDIDLRTHDRMKEVSSQLRDLQSRMAARPGEATDETTDDQS